MRDRIKILMEKNANLKSDLDTERSLGLVLKESVKQIESNLKTERESFLALQMEVKMLKHSRDEYTPYLNSAQTPNVIITEEPESLADKDSSAASHSMALELLIKSQEDAIKTLELKLT